MDRSDLHPSKRLRIEDPASPPASSTTKGKEKMEESVAGDAYASPSPEATCGICLLDGGRSIRGRIDSCDHFFCFVCIMEWAKIESRCPTCKRRFETIRRPAAGIFRCERVVNVPRRDQVYHPLGNESTTLSDPYEHVNCSACQSSVDEDLILLCDLCDSAAHTYCVGLGYTVPEGDWYCLDCTISRDEHSKSESDADCYSQHSYINLGPVRISEPPVSLSEIVSDEVASDSSQNLFNHSTIPVLEAQRNDDRSVSRITSQRLSQDSMLHIEQSSSPIPVGKTVSSVNPPVAIASESPLLIFETERRNDRPPSRSILQRAPQDSILHTEQLSTSTAEDTLSTQPEGIDKGPRTLIRCRNLHSRIRALRENWNALRAGSLVFSSNVVNGNDTTCNRKQEGSRANSDAPRPTHSSTLFNGDQSTANTIVSNEKHISRDLQGVDRAWKMMEIAKSIHKTQRGTVSVSNHSINSHGKKNISKGVKNLHSSSFVSKCLSARKGAGGTESGEFRHLSPKAAQVKCKSQYCDKTKSDAKTMKEMTQIYRGPGNTPLSGYSELASNKQDKFSLKDVCDGKKENPEVSSLSFTNATDFSCHKVEPLKRKQGACRDADGTLMRRNEIGQKSTEGNVYCINLTGRYFNGQNIDESSIRRNDITNNAAKDEVQSLVKLNLKLLIRDQHLGTQQFKEVARVATHTILAACGLEHSKADARSFSSSICGHSKQTKKLRKSNLMPNSCRECFYTFVKNVVESVLSEKTHTPH